MFFTTVSCPHDDHMKTNYLYIDSYNFFKLLSINKFIYFYRDNPMADIYGANLYNRILQRKAVCPDEVFIVNI